MKKLEGSYVDLKILKEHLKKKTTKKAPINHINF